MKLDPDLRRLRWLNIFVAALNAASTAVNLIRHQWVLAFVVVCVGCFSSVIAIGVRSQQITRNALREMQHYCEKDNP